jgi:ribonucleoside-triphosphate reductase
MNGTPYYTNSSHLPVGYTEDIFSALDIQDELQTLYTSGTVFHAFLGEKLPDWKAAASLVKKIAENYKLPYYTMSPTYSVCKEHGYLNGEQPVCPHCGQKTEVYSRITGYYRPVANWNDGKAQEYKDRKVYNIGTSQLTHKGPKTESFVEAAVKKSNKESGESLDNLTADTVMLFKTQTCPNCVIAGTMLDKAGVIYKSLDANEHPDLVEKFGIMQAPTLVIASEDGYRKLHGVSDIKAWIKESFAS